MAMALLTGARYLRLVEIRGAPGRQEQGPHEGARAVQRYADRRRQEQGAHVDYKMTAGPSSKRVREGNV